MLKTEKVYLQKSNNIKYCKKIKLNPIYFKNNFPLILDKRVNSIIIIIFGDTTVRFGLLASPGPWTCVSESRLTLRCLALALRFQPKHNNGFVSCLN
jgi:hypothetical protein